MTRQAWLSFGLCFWVAFFDGMDTSAIAYIAPYLREDWGLSKEALAPVLSAALWGLAVGALSAGFLADRFGRLKILNGSVFLFSLLSMLAAGAQNLSQLEALRFVTGLGLGAAMPNAVALLSEAVPASRRAFFINTMYCGFPLGIAAGGFLAAQWIPSIGWRQALFASGLMPLMLLFLMLLFLRESASLRQQQAPSFAVLFQQLKRYRYPTALLCFAYFAGLMVFYSIINWLPLIFQAAQYSQETGSRIAGLFALGGLGAIAGGYFMDRYPPHRVSIALAVGTSLSLCLCAYLWSHQMALLGLAIVLAGLFHNSTQNSLIALAAQFYPVHCRSSGVALMLGLGRFGAVAGTYFLAWRLQANDHFPRIFMMLAFMPLTIAAALALKAHFIQKRFPPVDG